MRPELIGFLFLSLLIPEFAVAAEPANTAEPRVIEALRIALQWHVVEGLLTALSIAVIALTLERIYCLLIRREEVLPSRFAKQLQQVARQKDLSIEQRVPVREMCTKYPSPLSRITAALLQRSGVTLASLEATLQDSLREEFEILAGPSHHLSFLAKLSPFVGLLGTVAAIMLAFFDSTQATVRDAALVRSISTALAATLAGILIAVLAMLAAHLSRRQLQAIFARIETPLKDLCVLISAERQKP